MPTARRILSAFQSLSAAAQHDTLLLLVKSMDTFMAYTAILVRRGASRACRLCRARVLTIAGSGIVIALSQLCDDCRWWFV